MFPTCKAKKGCGAVRVVGVLFSSVFNVYDRGHCILMNRSCRRGGPAGVNRCRSRISPCREPWHSFTARYMSYSGKMQINTNGERVTLRRDRSSPPDRPHSAPHHPLSSLSLSYDFVICMMNREVIYKAEICYCLIVRPLSFRPPPPRMLRSSLLSFNISFLFLRAFFARLT